MMKTLKLYKKDGFWMFDAPEFDLVEEPFVQGSTEIIDQILKDFGIFQGSHRGVLVHFSDTREFIEMVEAVKIEDLPNDWATYRYKDLTGDLCPATLHYFGKHPDKIYIVPEKINDFSVLSFKMV